MAPLSVEDHLSQPTIDVSPPKWHLGHTSWFFETFLLKPNLLGYLTFDPDFNFLFNSYYETVGDRLLRDMRGTMTRPSLDRVWAYRKHVDEAMEQLLDQSLNEEINALVELGLQHEQQHQELFLTDFKYILSVQPFHPVYSDDFKESLKPNGTAPNYIVKGEGLYTIGFADEGFCFDNELGSHKVYLHDFEISNQLVTNGQWMEFMADGGYTKHQFWHAEGWGWINEQRIKAPRYWEEVDDEWHRFSLAGLEKIKPEDPVAHISFYEAAAFAEWSGHRLPTEFEWEAASADFEWGQRWEWTNSAYLPYPNFSKAEGAVGEYNGKFMVNQMVLRGASVATSPNHSRPTYRNFFHPHLRWQYTGLRLVKK
jgi:ergothioneine biosynthesis protein EgtB